MAKERAKKEPAVATEGVPANGRGMTMPDAVHVDATFAVYKAGRYGHEELGLTPAQLLAMYRNMLLQRRFEERAHQMYRSQKIAGFLHLYIGQEAVSTGAVSAIRVGKDSVITAYRDHGIGLALGMSPNACMAELYGKIDGCSRGKGGSMHYFDAGLRMFGGHGIVGAHVPVGVGIAFAHKYKADGGVCLVFLGDGAVGQGAFHEALNLAGLYKLPVVVVIENNQYAMGTAVHRAFAVTDFTRHAVSYGLEAALVDGMDAFSVARAFQDHVALAREGKPSLLEVRTYRYQGHSMSDPGNYRTKEELEEKKQEDAILRMKSYLLEHDLAGSDALEELDAAVKDEVLAAVAFAEQSPFPPLETIYQDVYTQPDYPFLGRG